MAVFLRYVADYANWLYALFGVGFLLYLRSLLQARQELDQALFGLEREAASGRVTRAALVMLVFLGMVGGVYATENYIAPDIELPREKEEEVIPPILFTPTGTMPAITSTPTTMVTATATPSPRPTRQVPATATPTVAPTPPPPDPCPGSRAKISSPAPGARLQGTINVQGTADIPNFEFYKVEWAPASNPDNVHVITTEQNADGLHRAPVRDGVLSPWNTDLVPPGERILRLTIVDVTGNYPAENICEVQVTVVP